MSLLHALAAHARGHVTGIQSAQRDWSPFLAHFTNWSAMRPLRAAVKDGLTAAQVTTLLDEADEASFAVVTKILAAGAIRARSPSDKDGLPACVCLSECTLAGLMSHSERYGRFGFVFSKASVFDAGGRPCLYLGRDEYGAVAALARGADSGAPLRRIHALSNVYDPPRAGARVQDYTHEREWRVFHDLGVATVEALIAPRRFVAPLLREGAGVPVIPLDMLFEWGA